MKTALLFQPSSSNLQYCKLGTKEVFPFHWLILFHQIILREGYIPNDCFFDSQFLYEL